MFANTPQDKAVECAVVARGRLRSNAFAGHPVGASTLKRITRFFFSMCFFTLNGAPYTQLSGTPMGSSMSGEIANCFMSLSCLMLSCLPNRILSFEPHITPACVRLCPANCTRSCTYGVRRGWGSAPGCTGPPARQRLQHGADLPWSIAARRPTEMTINLYPDICKATRELFSAVAGASATCRNEPQRSKQERLRINDRSDCRLTGIKE